MAPCIASHAIERSLRLRATSALRPAWLSIVRGRCLLAIGRERFIESTSIGEAGAWAEHEPSVSAFHLAFGPDDNLYVTGPTVSSFDSITRFDQDVKAERVLSWPRPATGVGFLTRLEILRGCGIARASRDCEDFCAAQREGGIGRGGHEHGGRGVWSAGRDDCRYERRPL